MPFGDGTYPIFGGSAGAVPPPGPPAYLIAGSRIALHNGLQQATVAALQNNYGYVTMISPPWESKSPRFGWAGFYGQTSQGELPVGNDVTIEGAVIEIGGVKTTLRFGGATSGTVPNGGYLYNDEDDTIILPPNTIYRIGWADTVGLNQYRPAAGHPVLPLSIISTADSPARGDASQQGATSRLATMLANTTGNPVATPNLVTQIGGPCLFVAKPTNRSDPNVKAILLVGDSIGWSQNQYQAQFSIVSTDYGALGFLGKGLNDDTNGRIPWANFSVPGTRYRDLVIGGSGGAGENGFTMRAAMLAAMGWPFTAIINEHGINTVAGFNAATSLQHAAAGDAALKGYGNRFVAKTTLPPQTSSADDPSQAANTFYWTSSDEAKQVKSADASHSALDTYIAGKPVNVDLVIDIRPSLESSTGSRKWKGTSTDGYSGTLAAAVSSGTTISLNTAPPKGAHILLDAGDPTLAEMIILMDVTGSGPYTATTKAAITKAHALSATALEQPTPDGTHQTRLTAGRAKTPIIAAKPSIPALVSL